MSNQDHYEGDDQVEFTDLFRDREQVESDARQAYEREHARHNLENARKSAAMKADEAASRSRMRNLPEGSASQKGPDIEEFSDTERYSMQRLNPSVQITSMEEEERRQQEEGFSNSQDMGTTRRFETEPLNNSQSYAEGSSSYQEPEHPSDSGEGYPPSMDDRTEDTDYRSDVDYDYDEQDDDSYYNSDDENDDDDDRDKHQGLTIGVISAIIVLLLAAIAVVLIFGQHKITVPVDDSSSSLVETESVSVSGVITNLDTKHKTMLVYSADTKKEMSFSDFDDEVALSKFQVGDIITLSYDKGDQPKVTKVQSAKDVVKLTGVSGVTPAETSIVIDKVPYTVDDYTVCRYQGKAYDRRAINKNTVFTAYILDKHIYTIEIEKEESTGTVEVLNLSSYKDVGGQLVITPSDGSPISQSISSDSMKTQVEEGSALVKINVTKDNQTSTAYQENVFVTAGETVTVTAPTYQEKKGKVSFTTAQDVTFTVEIKGKTYDPSDQISLTYGDYNAVIKADGYDDQTIPFTVSQPYQEVTVTFEKKTAKVTISVSADGVSLYIDSTYQGEVSTETSFTTELEAGTYTVTCTKTGYYDQSQTLTIGDDLTDQVLYFSGFTPVENSSESSSESSESSRQEEPSQSSSQPESSPEQPDPSSTPDDPNSGSGNGEETGSDSDSGN